MNIKEISDTTIAEAVSIIKNGGVVVLPTDTNYNVMTSPYSKSGVDRIFAMKKREHLSPLTLFLSDSMDLHDFSYVTPDVDTLAKLLWPEKISFILHQKSTVPDYITRGFGSVAVTLHRHAILRKITHLVGTPLAGTSANLSGTGTVPQVEKAAEPLGGSVDLILDAGLLPIDGSNTMIDFTFNPPILARLSAYPLPPLKQFIPNLVDHLDNKSYKDLVKNRALEK